MRERYTGKSRGFGFVTFASVTDAQRAITAEHIIDGRRCEAKFALPEGKVGSARTTRIFVARIPSSVSDAQFRAYFEQFGAIQDAYMPKDPSKQGHRGIGFVTYANTDAVERVMSRTHVLNGNEVAIDRATPKERTPAGAGAGANAAAAAGLVIGAGMLPGRLSMSQPNLHLLAGGGSGHGGNIFAFMQQQKNAAAMVAAGGGSGGAAGAAAAASAGMPMMAPHSPNRYDFAHQHSHASASAAAGLAHGGGGGDGGLGARHMSHPVLSMSAGQFGSPPSAAAAAMAAAMSASYSSGANLQALAAQQQQQQQQQAAVAALQHHFSSTNSLSSLDGGAATTSSGVTVTPPTPEQQQQLINLINASNQVATAGGVPHPGSSGHFPPTTGSAASSANDLTALVAEQQQQQQSPQHQPALPAHASWHGRPPPSATAQQQQQQQQQYLQAAAALAAANVNANANTPHPPLGPPSSRAGPRIFVGKLNRDTSDQDVKDYFSRFGYVLDVYLPRDKSNKREHRGFGFVTFETDASIQRVVTHGPHHIRGSVIAIDAAVPRQDEYMFGVGGGGGGGGSSGGPMGEEGGAMMGMSMPMPMPPSSHHHPTSTGQVSSAEDALQAMEKLTLASSSAAATAGTTNPTSTDQ